MCVCVLVLVLVEWGCLMMMMMCGVVWWWESDGVPVCDGGEMEEGEN